MMLALATAVAFGTCTDVPTEWTVAYTDGVTDHFTTPTNRLDFEPRPSHRFTIVQCQADLCSLGQEFAADPLPGDIDLDGVVGAPDLMLLMQNWGKRAP